MNEIIAISCFLAVVISCKKLYDRFVIPDSDMEQEQTEEQQYTINDFQSIKQQIQALQQTTDRIDSLNNLIIDISICNSDSLKNITISCPDSVSNDSTHSFIINGTDSNSRLLQGLAEEEKQQLVNHLLKQIQNLYDMICHKQNVSKSIPDSMKGELFND